MRAHCLILENPFDLSQRRYAHLRRPVKIKRLAPRCGRPVIAVLNGRPIMRAEWRRRLRDGDQLIFQTLPRGRALATVLSIALMVVAPGLGAVLGPALGIGVNLATAAVGLVGSALISALVPQQGAGALSIPAASPTYSLQAQGNSARLEQPIPVQYGRMLFSPDWAAQPYTEFVGNEQYLYQLLSIGAGDYLIEEVRIEDTPITSFADVTTETVAPGGQVTLFPTAVVTSVEVAGQDMPGLKTGSWARTATTVTVTETAHGRVPGQSVYLDLASGGGPTGVYTIATVPTVDTFTVTTATGAGSGTSGVYTVIGGASGFVASAPGTVVNRIAVDLILPRGLFAVSGSNLVDASLSVYFYARLIDDNGIPLGGWMLLGGQNLVNRTSTPQRYSFGYPVTPGRYAVMAYRTDIKSTSTTAGHDVAWGGLRAYMTAPQNFGNVTLLAIRMRASNSLSALASRRIKVLATRKLPIWNGSTWSAATATRSIAWAMADAARDAGYGAGLTDARIDLAALLALDAIWTARGDNFDGRFDQSGTWWDAITRIAAAGRAKAYLQGGILRIVRDAAATVPVQMFTMRNIVKGSFGITYLTPTEATADKVEVSYFDNIQWQPQRVTASLPASAALKPVKVELFGVTGRAHAMREGTYLAAANTYRRRIVRFETEMEGLIASLGDLIAIQHDMPAWGAQAEAVAWNAGTRTLTLNEPMTFGSGTYVIALRRRDGTVSGPYTVTPGGTAYQVVLAVAPDFTPYTGGNEERTHVVFGGFGAGNSVTAKILSTRPRGVDRVAIEAVVEDANVHTADQGIIVPSPILSGLPRAVTAPIVTGLIGRAMPTDTTRVALAWRPAPGAETYQVEMAEGSDVNDPNVTWTRIGDTTAANYVAQLLAPAQSMIRVRGVGLVAGPWNAVMVGTLIGLFWGADGAAHFGADGAAYWSS